MEHVGVFEGSYHYLIVIVIVIRRKLQWFTPHDRVADRYLEHSLRWLSLRPECQMFSVLRNGYLTVLSKFTASLKWCLAKLHSYCSFRFHRLGRLVASEIYPAAPVPKTTVNTTPLNAT